MSEGQSHSIESINAAESTPETPLAAEIQQLPAEMRTMVSVMAGIFRSTSGPDPETARLMAETEMHEETCKLEGYKQSLKARDAQNGRDHAFRIKKMNHDTFKSVLIIAVSIAGIICGLYLIVAKQNSSVGTPLLVAAFMAMLGGKSLLPEKKE